jgi:hypothetical protein
MKWTFVPVLALGACAAALPASAPYSWDSVAIGGGGFVTAIVTSRGAPGAVYARTDVGGAYRWDGATGRWQALLDWVGEDQAGLLGVDALAVDPQNAANLYLLAGIAYLNGGRTAILRSHDAGKSFTVTDVTAQFKMHGNGMGRQAGERLVVDPGNGRRLYAGTRFNGLFTSADAGQTWARIDSLPVTTTPNGAGIVFVAPDAASVKDGMARRLLVGVSRVGAANLYRSDDAGATFQAVAGAPADLMPQRAAFDGAGHLYITYADGAGPHPDKTLPEPMQRGQVWQYALAGGAWRDVTPAGWTRPFAGIGVDPANPRRLVTSTINTFLPQGDAKGDRIFTSVDAGAHWVDVVARGFVRDGAGVPWMAGHAIHWAGSVAFDPGAPRAVWVTSGNGVFRTPDIDATPATWTFTVRGLEETVPLGLTSIPGGPLVSVIGDYDGFLHADVTQYGRIHMPQMGTTTGLAVAGSTMVRVGDAMYVTADGGAHWTKTAHTMGVRGQVALSSDGRTMLHSPEKQAATYRSTDGGATWRTVAGLGQPKLVPVADPVAPDTFYAYDDGALLVSTDGGASFAQRGTLPKGGAALLRLAPDSMGDLWAPLRSSGLAHSRDGGAHFQMVPGVTYCGAVGFGKAAPGHTAPALYIWGTVAGVRGVHRSLDGGATWLRINDAAHQYGGPGDAQFIVGDMNTFGVVYMSTAGRGIVVGTPQPISSTIE